MGASMITGYAFNRIDNRLLTQQLLKESTCTQDELYRYLSKNVGKAEAERYLSKGVWPDKVQIPKDSSFINTDGSQNWDKVPKGGYTLDSNGEPIKSIISPKKGDVIDRYGSPTGGYTSPVESGKSFDYTERSLPYVEDVRQYHRYEVMADFSDFKEYLDKCTDPKVVKAAQYCIDKYANGNIDLATSYSGTAAPAYGWGSGGATQWQLMEPVGILEKLGMVKEYKVPPAVANPQTFIPDGKEYGSGKNIIDSKGE